MRFVGGARRVDPIARVLPNDVVFGLIIKVEVMHKHPKVKEFRNVVDGDGSVMFDLEDPSVPLQSLTHLPILSLRCLID